MVSAAAAAVAGPRRARLRRPRRRTAAGAPPGAPGVLLALVAAFAPVAWLVRVAVGLVVLGAGRPRRALRRARALGLGPARDRPRPGAAAARAVVDPGGPGVRGRGPAARRRAPARRDGRGDRAARRPLRRPRRRRWRSAWCPPSSPCSLWSRAPPACRCWCAGWSPSCRPPSPPRSARCRLDLAAVTVSAGPASCSCSCRPRSWSRRCSAPRAPGPARRARTGGRPAARVAIAVLAVVAAVVPATGLAWFVAGGDAAPRRGPGAAASRPTWCRARRPGPSTASWCVRGTVEDGLTYTVRRGDGVTLGEDEILDLSPEDAGFTDAVRALASRPTPELVDRRWPTAASSTSCCPRPPTATWRPSLDATGGLLAGQRGGPHHPGLAGRPAAEPRRRRRDPRPGCASCCWWCRASPCCGCSSSVPRPPTGGVHEPLHRPAPAGQQTGQSTGRRSATRRGRLEVTAVLAVLAPVLTGSLLAARWHRAGGQADLGAPEQTTLRTATLGCPEGRKDGDRGRWSRPTARRRGEVRVGRGADAEDPRGRSWDDRQPTPPGRRVTVRAEGDLAPGLVAGRVGGSPLGAAQCASPERRDLVHRRRRGRRSTPRCSS